MIFIICTDDAKQVNFLVRRIRKNPIMMIELFLKQPQKNFHTFLWLEMSPRVFFEQRLGCHSKMQDLSLTYPKKGQYMIKHHPEMFQI